MCALSLSVCTAPCDGGGKEDKELGGAAGRDANEEAGNQTQTFRGTRDHHGPRERIGKIGGRGLRSLCCHGDVSSQLELQRQQLLADRQQFQREQIKASELRALQSPTLGPTTPLQFPPSRPPLRSPTLMTPTQPTATMAIIQPDVEVAKFKAPDIEPVPMDQSDSNAAAATDAHANVTVTTDKQISKPTAGMTPVVAATETESLVTPTAERGEGVTVRDSEAETKGEGDNVVMETIEKPHNIESAKDNVAETTPPDPLAPPTTNSTPVDPATETPPTLAETTHPDDVTAPTTEVTPTTNEDTPAVTEEAPPTSDNAPPTTDEAPPPPAEIDSRAVVGESSEEQTTETEREGEGEGEGERDRAGNSEPVTQETATEGATEAVARGESDEGGGESGAGGELVVEEEGGGKEGGREKKEGGSGEEGEVVATSETSQEAPPREGEDNTTTEEKSKWCVCVCSSLFSLSLSLPCVCVCHLSLSLPLSSGN